MRKRHKKKLRRMELLLGKTAIAARLAGQALRLMAEQFRPWDPRSRPSLDELKFLQ